MKRGFVREAMERARVGRQSGCPVWRVRMSSASATRGGRAGVWGPKEAAAHGGRVIAPLQTVWMRVGDGAARSPIRIDRVVSFC